jgi:uncharacterized protein (UPF0305 family)
MSAPGDWPAVDMNHVSLPTIVSSSDLFDGELFGDELIDIYNSTVDGHGGNDGKRWTRSEESNFYITHLTVCSISRVLDISNLLAPPETKKGEEDADEMLAAIDDGFGTFRPSTSFNDLSSLLSPAVEEDVVNPRSVAPVAAPVEEKKSTKKRAASTAVAPPSPKRKASNGRRVSMGKKDAATTKKSATTKGKAPGDKSTPNPLTIAVAAARAKVPPIPTQITTVVTCAPVPTAVTSCDIVTKQEESDFKTIAQAAVSSLILSATGTDATAPAAESFSEKVDTSTAHIKALTGNNWVAACAGTTQGIGSVSSDVDSKGNNRNRRHNLTPDERARQNRDRNREHARNTRLRKKAYVEELKRTLTELVSQRDATEFEKRQAAQREMEQREVRFRVIEEFLKLRGRNETNFARWAAILEDGFNLTLPSTDFRKMAQGEAVPGVDRVLNGVSDVMADANGFSEFLQTLGNGEGAVTCQYQCDRKNFFMDGCQAVLEWTATSIGAINKVRL